MPKWHSKIGREMSQISKIETMIYVIRGQRVMLDSDLANLYGVETGALNRQVKRNIERFPKDFMFELNQQEFNEIRKSGNSQGGRRSLPRVFTENGVAMLSGVINSDKAIKVNISIMRTFTKMRALLAEDESLVEKLSQFEKGTAKLFQIVFDRLEALERETPSLSPKRKKISLKEDK
tara:strand:+ start:1638 stop:2171 length:534 start_codon:yes stop_codon:yes gene_type:complete